MLSQVKVNDVMALAYNRTIALMNATTGNELALWYVKQSLDEATIATSYIGAD